MRKKRYPKTKLHIRRRGNITVASFEYHLSRDVGFHFSILCECRDDIQAIMKKKLADRGYEFDEIEIDARPWIVTRIWKKGQPREREVLEVDPAKCA